MLRSFNTAVFLSQARYCTVSNRDSVNVNEYVKMNMLYMCSLIHMCSCTWVTQLEKTSIHSNSSEHTESHWGFLRIGKYKMHG